MSNKLFGDASDFQSRIEQFELSDPRKEYLVYRWLDQYRWFEKRAGTMQKWYRRLRLTVVVGGVLVPSLLAFRLPSDLVVTVPGLKRQDESVSKKSEWEIPANGVKDTGIFFISLIVAISAAIEEFFSFGEKYGKYRRAAEAIKSEYWKFRQLAGPYQKFRNPAQSYASNLEEAYPKFAQRVEQVIEEDVRSFTEILDEQLSEDRQHNQEVQRNTQTSLSQMNQELEKLKVRLKAVKDLSDASVDPSTLDTTLDQPLQLQPPKSSTSTPSSTSSDLVLPPLGIAALPWEEFSEPSLPPINETAPHKNLSSSLQQSWITPEVASKALECSLDDCNTYLPGVLSALHAYKILDNNVLIGILATIRVETGGFKPVHEWGGEDYWKRYEGRADLGNVQQGDGIRYHGRGYIQLTGRANYRTYGDKLGVNLIDNPDLAMDPGISAQILASYFVNRGVAISARDTDWRAVRKKVNGGYNGWDEFSHYVDRLKFQLLA